MTNPDNNPKVVSNLVSLAFSTRPRTGTVAAYKRLGIQELYLPTADHFEPTVADLTACVQFIQQHEAAGSRVYVHCRAGHGRSAAGVLAWLLAQDPSSDPQRLNQYLCTLRNVRKTLWKQTNIRRFHANLKEQQQADADDDDDDGDANGDDHDDE